VTKLFLIRKLNNLSLQYRAATQQLSDRGSNPQVSNLQVSLKDRTAKLHPQIAYTNKSFGQTTANVQKLHPQQDPLQIKPI
jgi:hypothetical protein